MLKLLTDFSAPLSVTAWFSINDRVMGGVSQSALRHDPRGHAVFSGTVSFENHGGFASVRSPPAEFSASGASAYVLDLCGDGKRYKLSLRTDDGFDGINYQCRLEPPPELWSCCRLAVADFVPSFRGRPVSDAPPLDPARVRQIGLVIADHQAGPFALSLRSISAEIAPR